MISIIALVLITYIVPGVLSLVSISASKAKPQSLYDFAMKPAGAVAIIGAVGAGFSIFLCILAIYTNQFEGWVAAVFVGFALMGILMILAPVNGVWDTYVKGDRILARRFFIVRNEYSISEIDYCQYNQNGLVVYMKNGKKTTINVTCTNIPAFEKRMEAEGIEVRMIQDQ